jgi:hypothetical protein
MNPARIKLKSHLKTENMYLVILLHLQVSLLQRESSLKITMMTITSQIEENIKTRISAVRRVFV